MRHGMLAKDTAHWNLISHKCDIKFQWPSTKPTFFLSRVITLCWRDLKGPRHRGGKIMIIKMMIMMKMTTVFILRPYDYFHYVRSSWCVGAREMRPVGCNPGWHSPTSCFPDSMASTFMWCLIHTYKDTHIGNQTNNNVKRKRHREESYTNTRGMRLC